MYQNRYLQGARGPALLVTALSIMSITGCGGSTDCGEGTVLSDGVCVPDPGPGDACSVVDACATPPDNAAAFQEVVQGEGCICSVTQCAPSYQLQNNTCVALEECPVGFEQDGNLCVPITDVSCIQAPNSPLCIPALCDEIVDFTAIPLDPNGNVWNAQSFEAAGKCIARAPPPVESCTTGCHSAIEAPHPWFSSPELSCTGCHGGTPVIDPNDPRGAREQAHVPLPANMQVGQAQIGRPNLQTYWNYYTLTGVEQFQGGPEWLRFRNPADLRVADLSCGKNSGCHQDRVNNVRRSVMATASGLVGISQARNGIPRDILRQGGDQAVYKYDTTAGMSYNGQNVNSLAPASANYIGSVRSLTAFTIADREIENVNYDQIDILKEIYDKQCGDCHLNNAGANNRYADFRSSGCASCHMNYALDGISRSSDPLINHNEPTYPNAYAQIANFDANDLQDLNQQWLGPERAHPRTHRLTRQMTAQKCGTCHVGSNRTDWQFRGYQIDPNRTVLTAFQNGDLNADQFQFTDEINNNQNAFARYHGQAQDQVLRFVDWNNDGFDDIPADIHYLAGLECMDCHTSDEMHNELKMVKVAQVSDWGDSAQVDDMSGALWSHMDQSTEIECVHCHGNLEYRAVPFEGDNRNPIKNLIACPEAGESIPNYTPPSACANLGSGRWLRSKFTGNYHYVTQTYDTVRQNSGALDDRGNALYSLNASFMHGRWDLNNLNNDGVGPCQDPAAAACFRDQANNAFPVTVGFSHLGATAQSPVDQHSGGLECYACHSTWGNNCSGCHLRLADNDGNNVIRDYARSTGKLTLGAVTEADFTIISPLDRQFGINSEGKISSMLPETKQMVAHTDANNNEFFGNEVIVNNDANIQWNAYRNRDGYGLFQFDANARVGLPPQSDGPIFEQRAEMDVNAGQGFQQFTDHTVQRSHPLMDCENCHVDVADGNAAAIQARYAANPTGFGNLSDYLAVLANVGITRNNSNDTYVVDAAAGFRFDANTDPDGFVIDQQSDWCVDIATGFPYCYNNHPIKVGPNGQSLNINYPRNFPTLTQTAGPFNLFLMNKMFNEIKVQNIGVELQGVR